jgi:FeS assembly SUF system protein
MSEVISKDQLKNAIIDMLRTIYDPEIPVNIYDIGLIYEINVFDNREVELIMTLTSPNCPVAGTMPGEVEEKVKTVEGVVDVTLELVFEPAWTQEMMSEEAKLELGFL